jgi:hypothetical protein
MPAAIPPARLRSTGVKRPRAAMRDRDAWDVGLRRLRGAFTPATTGARATKEPAAGAAGSKDRDSCLATAQYGQYTRRLVGM